MGSSSQKLCQLLCCHRYLDSIGLQKPPEAHFVQGSCVRHPTVPNNGVSQSKNLSFVAGVCQGFGVSRWRSNRRKSTLFWSWTENKRGSERTALISHTTKGKTSSYVKTSFVASTFVNTPHPCYLQLNIQHREQGKAFASPASLKKSTRAVQLRPLTIWHIAWTTDDSWGLAIPWAPIITIPSFHVV